MKRTNIYFLVLFIVLLVFEVFSYLSSKNTLMSLTGMDLWSTLIAFSFCAVDLAGLPLIQVKRQSPDLVKMISFAWALTVLGDTAMTWYSVAMQTSTLKNHILVQSGIVPESFVTVIIPLGVALITWMIQTLLVHWVNKEAEIRFSSQDIPPEPVRRHSAFSTSRQ